MTTQEFWARIRRDRPELSHLGNDAQFGTWLGMLLAAERKESELQLQALRDECEEHVKGCGMKHCEGCCVEDQINYEKVTPSGGIKG